MSNTVATTVHIEISAVIQDVIVALLAAISIAVVAFLFRNTIVRLIKKSIPRINSKTPHVSFDISSKKSKMGEWQSMVQVSNASNEPAYNLFVHYFEQVAGKNFSLKASDSRGEITRSVLGIRDKLEYKFTGTYFDGCSVTSDQEIWVEYENSLGLNFRVVIVPEYPRGDVARINPPKVIRKRLESVPGFNMTGDKKLARKYKKGKVSYFPKQSIFSVIKYKVFTVWGWKIKDKYKKLVGQYD